MAKRKEPSTRQSLRSFTPEFKQEAVKVMVLDGHSASSVSKNLGIGNTNQIYRWKALLIGQGGPATKKLDTKYAS